MILKRLMNDTAAMLIADPYLPKWNGPLGKYFRPVKTLAKNGMAYETELRMINDPVRSPKAVELPRGIAPRPSEIMATNIVAGTGQLSVSLTVPKRPESGTALSRANAQ